MSEARGKPGDWTYAEYARLPDDGNHYEVIDGEVLVTPAPSTRHQHAAGNLYLALRSCAERHDLGIVLFDVDLLFASGQFLRPDLVFVTESGRAGLTDRGVETAPVLVVEVSTPSSRSIDMVQKPARYRDFGVPEYWVADPVEQVIWKWNYRVSSTPERCGESITWQPDPSVSALSMAVAEVFRPL